MVRKPRGRKPPPERNRLSAEISQGGLVGLISGVLILILAAFVAGVWVGQHNASRSGPATAAAQGEDGEPPAGRQVSPSPESLDALERYEEGRTSDHEPLEAPGQERGGPSETPPDEPPEDFAAPERPGGGGERRVLTGPVEDGTAAGAPGTDDTAGKTAPIQDESPVEAANGGAPAESEVATETAETEPPDQAPSPQGTEPAPQGTEPAAAEDDETQAEEAAVTDEEPLEEPAVDEPAPLEPPEEPTSPATGTWVVQIQAYGPEQRDAAEAYAQEAGADIEYEPRVVRYAGGLKVVAGAFETREDAQAFCNELKQRREYEGAWVREL
jgi:hypothetical protein